MSLNLSQPKRKNAISLTPLIDVVFILLLFFMLTSSFVPWRILDTPLAVATDKFKDITEKNSLIVTLKSNDESVWFEGNAISFADQASFEKLVIDHNDGIFMIKAEDGVTLQTLLHLADQLKLHGAKSVSIANAFAMTSESK